MTCLLDSHDMLGFIDGKLTKPQEYSDGNCCRYRKWKRSDILVKGWIFGSIREDVMGIVVGLDTASDVWNKLEENYTTPPAAPASSPHPLVSTTTGKKGVAEYVPLCRAIQMGDWKKAKDFIDKDKDALIDKLNSTGETTIHIAIGSLENICVLENLLKEIDPESLPTMVTNKKLSALHYAAMIGNTAAAKMLVTNNPDLLFTPDIYKELPIELAASSAHKDTFNYLFDECKTHIGRSQEDGYENPFEGENGATCLAEAISAGFLDVAYLLLNDYPALATTMTPALNSPLRIIAKKRDTYLSAKQYNFYQRFVYTHVPTPNGLKDTHKTGDIENQGPANCVTQCTKNYVYPVIERIYDKVWKVALLRVPHIKHLHEEKMKHKKAVRILKFICEEVGKLKSNHFEHYSEAYIEAIKNNTPEVIDQITQIFPHSIWGKRSGYTISQLSIVNRCEKVFNFLVHEVTHDKYNHIISTDEDRNNLLHLAGRLAPAHKLDLVTGEALQMQRELQWFQEVSNLVRPKHREAMNKKQETPIMVFRKEHKDLRRKGEEWMIKTANSYTIVAALIITIAFAAAITVPGGNNENTGKVIFQAKKCFIIFVISGAISFFTSTTSLLLFLSILTARYAYEDFLYMLPKRLILGLVMLFMSVTTMVIAYSATLYLMFELDTSWFPILLITMACLPIVSFVTLQLPLLADLIYSTYGSGIFGKQSELRVA